MTDPAKQVEPIATPWAPPGNHHLISVNIDGILRSCGVREEHVRRRLAAHAIVASGWRQAVWCHSPWGVKVGSGWAGPWYSMDTHEDDGTGQLYEVKGAKWRAFKYWCLALQDYQGRISPSSTRYRKAHAALVDAGRPDSEYWRELGVAGYYTDTKNMTPAGFASVCKRVKNELSTSTPEERATAAAIEVGPTVGPAGLWGVLGLVVLAVVVAFALR